jgi:hypothetical protein
MISGDGVYQTMTGAGPRSFKTTFDFHIETVSARPETQVTIHAHLEGLWDGGGGRFSCKIP